jgi:puromycin-sensitive aminopeptidase
LYSNIFEKLGWDGKDGEDHLTHMLRSLVIPKLGRAGHDGIISESCKRFSAFAASGFKDGLIPDLRAGVYSIVIDYFCRICLFIEFFRY